MGLRDLVEREGQAAASSGPSPFAPRRSSAPAKKQEGGASLATQIAGVTKGLLPGMLAFGKDAAKQGVRSLRPDALKTFVDGAKAADGRGEGLLGQVGGGIRSANPFMGDVGASMKRTGGRVVDLGSVPFGKQTLGESQYGKASKEGTIFATAIEDVGNIAIVGSGASKALTAGAARTGSASLGRAASAAQKVTGAANAAADLPARPLQLAAKGLGAGAKPLGNALVNTERGAALAQRLSDAGYVGEGRAKLKEFRENVASARLEAGDLERRNFLKAESAMLGGKRLAKEAGVDVADLSHARNLSMTGVSVLEDLISQAPERVQPALRDKLHGIQMQPSEGTRALLGNEELLGKAREARAGLDDVTRMRESMMRERGLLSEEQLGDNPIQFWVDKELAPIKDKIAKRGKMLGERAKERDTLKAEKAALPGYETVKPRRTAVQARILPDGNKTLEGTMLGDAKTAGRLGEERGAATLRNRAAGSRVGSTKTSIKRLDKKLRETKAFLGEGPARVAPGKYKPALLGAERLRQGFKEVLDSGMLDEADTATITRLLEETPATMKALQERGIFPEYQIGGLEDPAFREGLGPGRQFAERKLIGEKRKRRGDVLKTDRREAERLQKDVSTMIQNDMISKVKGREAVTPRQMVEQEIADLHAKGLPLSEADLVRIRDLEDMSLRGHDVGAYMRDKGKVSISNRTDEALNLDSEFIDQVLLKDWKRLTEYGPNKSALARGWDKTTSGWKHLNLAANPMWNVGNALSQPIMQSVRGGMDPVRAVAGTAKMAKELRKERRTGQATTNSRFHGLGGTQDAIRSLAEDPDRGILSRGLQKSYDLNELLDTAGKENLYRYYLEQGMDPETATQRVLRAMGDMSNLSPVERQVKRVIPFYPWQKQATRMGIDMATRHPYRSAAVLQASQLGRGGDPSDPENAVDASDVRSGMLQLAPNWFVPIGGIDPFQSSVRSPLFNPASIPQSLNPIIKTGAYALDINLGRGRMNTRPGGQGSEKFQVVSPSEMAYFLAQQTGPIGRAALGAGMDPILRYDQGDPWLVRGKEQELDGGRLQQTYKPFNLPFAPQFIDEKALEKRKKDSAAKKKREDAQRKG